MDIKLVQKMLATATSLLESISEWVSSQKTKHYSNEHAYTVAKQPIAEPAARQRVKVLRLRASGSGSVYREHGSLWVFVRSINGKRVRTPLRKPDGMSPSSYEEACALADSLLEQNVVKDSIPTTYKDYVLSLGSLHHSDSRWYLVVRVGNKPHCYIRLKNQAGEFVLSRDEAIAAAELVIADLRRKYPDAYTVHRRPGTGNIMCVRGFWYLRFTETGTAKRQYVPLYMPDGTRPKTREEAWLAADRYLEEIKNPVTIEQGMVKQIAAALTGQGGTNNGTTEQSRFRSDQDC